jgi:hypothetical protein
MVCCDEGDAFESTLAHGAVCTFPESASALLSPLTVTPPPAGVPAARLFPPGPCEPCAWQAGGHAEAAPCAVPRPRSGRLPPPDGAEAQRAALDEVDHAAGRAHHHVHAALQVAHLPGRTGTGAGQGEELRSAACSSSEDAGGRHALAPRPRPPAPPPVGPQLLPLLPPPSRCRAPAPGWTRRRRTTRP